MTLTDAGPLVALIDADEQDHQRCQIALATIAMPMLTTWPAFTEAMYLLGRAGGWHGQRALWLLIQRGHLQIAQPTPESGELAAKLMERYSDRPMDLADATLVALAQERNLTRIFTLDNDFHIYRVEGRRRFEVVPG